ncbi:hypothetical protein HDU97_004794 [Phlyctochytrium planicorne]|nr:hypothetical protein HDU97_004794 [Phlyctochytrium planicorne]
MEEALAIVDDYGNDVLSIVDELRALGLLSYGIDLPQIVVVGDQSSGKSSLLEYISGVPFPKGTNMCTTFATEVIMTRNPALEDGDVLGEVTLTPDPHSFNTADLTVRNKDDIATVITRIQAEFREHDGDVQQVNQDITLSIKLASKAYPRLTLVDLPGYVHVFLDGQSPTIVEDTASLAERFICNNRSIILAVIPATADIAGNIVLERAKVFDPKGERTMCVVTKIDLVEPGTETKIVDMVQGKHRKLALGYHVIKNRSQRDVDRNLLMQEHQASEKAFLSNQRWNGIPATDKGISSLTQKLVELLRRHVQEELPNVESDVKKQLKAAQDEIAALKDEFPSTVEKKSHMLLTAILATKAEWQSSLDGIPQPSNHVTIRSLMNVLFDKFATKIRLRTSLFTGGLSETDVEEQMNKNRGRERGHFLNFEVFKKFVKDCVGHWEAPTDEFIDKVISQCHEQLGSILKARAHQCLFRALKKKLHHYMENMEESCKRAAQEYLEDERSAMSMSGFITPQFQSEEKELIEDRAEKAYRSLRRIPNLSDVKQVDLDTMKDTLTKSGSLSAARTMILTIISHLEIVSERFIDSICISTIERIIAREGLGKMDTALKLDNVNLEELAETALEAANRSRLNEKLQRLQAAVDALRRI